MKKLENKVAVITGAALGLGYGIAKTYLMHGAKICMIDVDKSLESSAKKLLEQYPEKVIFQFADVTKIDEINKAVDKTIETFGKVDIACCNAGVCRLEAFDKMSDEIRDFHIDVNIKGVWNTCKAVIPHMLKNEKSSIVIASSVTGDLVADAGESAYALTKAALVGFTKALAIEYACKNIRVNCTQLGYARTPMVEKMAIESNPNNPESVIESIASSVPLGRLAKDTEVGELFAFLGSEESSYITGAQFVIDGGSTLPETLSMGTN